MRVTNNKRNVELYDVEFYINDTHTVKRGLTPNTVREMTAGYSHKKLQGNSKSWAALFDLTARTHWRNCADKEQERRAYKILNELNYFALNPELAITSELYEYIDSLPIKGQTKKEYVSSLSVILTCGTNAGLINSRPHLPKFKPDEAKDKIIIEPEDLASIQTYFLSTPIEIHSYFQVLNTLGSRPSETLRLKGKNMTKRGISFTRDIVKRKASVRTLPFKDLLENEFIVRRLKTDEKVFPTLKAHVFDYQWGKMLKALDLEYTGYTPYCLRHTKITNLVEAGHPIAKVRDWAGHANIQTTMTYTHNTSSTFDGM